MLKIKFKTSNSYLYCYFLLFVPFLLGGAAYLQKFRNSRFQYIWNTANMVDEIRQLLKLNELEWCKFLVQQSVCVCKCVWYPDWGVILYAAYETDFDTIFLLAFFITCSIARF